MENEQRPEQVAEQYQCCGLLEQDLTELCTLAGITSIPRVTVTPSPAADAASLIAEDEEQSRLGEQCIQVELQNDDPRSVCKVFLRGWKVEEEIMGVLNKCLPSLGNLKTLNFWSAGLTDSMLPALGTMVASCPQLWSLTLEGNPLPEHSFHVLIGASSTLSHLSLRNNCIDDTAAQLLGQGLSTMTSSNHNLLSLVLSFNCITDVGAEHIAEGLRWNRSLLSLSLGHNRIGDIGAQKLAEVLQPFKLKHVEVVERRRLQMESQGQPRAAEPSCGRPLSLHGSDVAGKLSPAKQNRSSTKRKDRLRKDDIKQSKKMSVSLDTRRGRLAKITEEQHSTDYAQAVEQPGPTHPLLEPGWQQDGNVILPGNRVLLNLNLAYNRITERGLRALLAAVEGQQQQEGAGGKQGLRRLSVHRNSFPATCTVLAQLQELLQQRDPLPQLTEEEEENSLDP
ncbi:leucine-rich repeat-containing protein 71 isoform X2 [Coturnix japonica]|uniref:leucine-rich repeat-containing protein 71 isoform X2 n=1 Tax=Coturnix japonica TaxID=93934 RepID=UPI0007779D2F|nr:leucine-rich repeat-containing protein 71 isoform X2 [Coturnix japonica]